MGIRGLMTYINRNYCFMENHNLHGGYIVIDGLALASHLFFSAYCNCSFGGDYDIFADCVRNFFDDLGKCEVIPLVIMDGGSEIRKAQTISSRQEAHMEAVGSYNPELEATTQIGPKAIEAVFISVLKQKRVRIVRCPFEADASTAAVAKVLNCPVISRDSDFYIFGVNYVPADNLSLFLAENPWGRGYVKPCKIFRPQYLLRSFSGLDLSALPLAAVLLGNDYVKRETFERFFKSLELPEKSSRLYSVELRRIDATLRWLRNYNLNDAVAAVLGEFPKKHRRKVLNIIEMTVDGYLNLPSDMLLPLGFAKQYHAEMKARSERKSFKFQGDVEALTSKQTGIRNETIVEGENSSSEDEEKEATPTTEDEGKEETPIVKDEEKQKTPTTEDEKKEETPIVKDEEKQKTPTTEDEKKEETPIVKDEEKQKTPTTEDEKKEETPIVKDEEKQETPTTEDEKKEETPIVKDEEKQETPTTKDEGKEEESPSTEDEEKQETPTTEDEEETTVHSLENFGKLMDEFVRSWPPWFARHYTMADFPGYFVDLMFHRAFCAAVQVEDFNYPSSSRISIKILRTIDGLIVAGREAPVLFYSMRVGSELVTRRINTLRGTRSTVFPALRDLRETSIDTRKQIFYDTLEMTGQEELIDEIPSQWRLYVATAIYWMRQAGEPPRNWSHLRSLLFTMLLGVINRKIGFCRSQYIFDRKYGKTLAKMESEQKSADDVVPQKREESVTEALQAVTVADCLHAASFFISSCQMAKQLRECPDKFNVTIVHVFAQFQSCLLFIADLSSLLGLAYERPMIGELFNGTMLYNLYVNFEMSSDVDSQITEILGKSPSLLRLLNLLIVKVKKMLDTTPGNADIDKAAA